MRIRLLIWFGALLLVPVVAGAQTLPPFQVKGYGVHGGGEIVYHYRVINNNPTNVDNPVRASRIEVGRASLDGEPELTGLPPVGYPPIYDDGVLSMSAPQGWNGVVSGEEENVRYTLLWKTVDIESPTSPYSLLPGQTLTGFSVHRKNPNSTFLDSHFVIIANDGAGEFSGIIEREDTTPPTLSVTLTPSFLRTRHERLVPIVATIAVKDDYDPAPEIKLESITANEPLEKADIQDARIGTNDRQFKLKAEREGKNKTGRIYTVTYSATDASGNKAMASATVTVAHDEREKGRDDNQERGTTERKD